jgi:ATP-binding cassette subfamily B protein
VQESLAAMNAALQENVSGIRLVKAYGLEEKEESRFAGICEGYYRQNIAVSRTSAVFHGAIGFLAGAGIAIVLLLGGWLVIRGSLTLGGFVAFNAYLAMLSFPTMALGWVINLVQRGGSAMGRINEFLRLPMEPAVMGALPSESANAAKAERPAAHEASAPMLRLRGLSFAYEGGNGRGEVLRGITFSVEPGEVVGLVGPTGSGKSTLLSLILRLYPVPPGTVFLEGRDINAIPLDELRRSVGMVAQDPFLFSDTVLENICFALDVQDEGMARRAAGQARILAEIDEMPDGFRTVIGERGISLSGGQKQRATIARALCSGAKILLLDDALSSVDAETEQEIFQEILSLRAGRTILFSTHRMSSLSRCDRILVLSGGSIAEEGTHDELLSLRGVYYDLYSRQMLSRELEASP